MQALLALPLLVANASFVSYCFDGFKLGYLT